MKMHTACSWYIFSCVHANSFKAILNKVRPDTFVFLWAMSSLCLLFISSRVSAYVGLLVSIACLLLCLYIAWSCLLVYLHTSVFVYCLLARLGAFVFLSAHSDVRICVHLSRLPVCPSLCHSYRLFIERGACNGDAQGSIVISSI